MAKIMIDKQAERKAIKLNYEMGFISYQDFVKQMADTMEYEERKMIEYFLQEILYSAEVNQWQVELQNKIDSKIAHHGVISALISEL